ncbi:hypothetical protein EGN72_13340 [Pseudorhodobacter sp. E13]|uniref:hypothetical protein n=1 Tax=Pseudorhodobacter sp. E13 TaxID=2487931 RepID=UPI000F8DBBB7|nr:hypothetical protein [Pseudorhodobacter sp. E13]RUS59676.1 hypothetical protein EGN72_13340 [Pseudorhodobacter sp. E13]
MADFEATGEELHQLVRLGKKRPMPFAFCPSAGGDSESLFATHRKKPPEMIAKSARKASGQTKVCFGTFTVEAKLMTLVLIKELPSIAKKLKKHLRHERLPLNVKVVDVMGNELETDIEDLPDDPILDADEEEIDDTDAPEEASADTTQPDPDDDLPDPKDLARQLKALQPGIMALQGDAGDKLRAALGGAVGLLKAGDLVRAESTINAIGRAYDRQAKAAAAPPPPPPPPNADALAAAQRLKKLHGQTGLLQGPAQEKLGAALGLVAKMITGGDLAKASQTMDAVEQAMTRAKADAAPKPDSATPAAPTAEAPAPTEAARKWDAIAAKLEPVVLATIKAGKGDIDAIKLKFYAMQDQAAAGQHEAAIAAAPALAEMIRSAQAATQTQAEAAIPADVVPFVKSRLAWINTRTQLRAEMQTLKSAMDTALSNIEGMEEAIAETGKLFTYLDALDNRLENTLEDLVKTPDGPERQALKAKAREIIAEYSAELDGDFFRDVDGDNGFAPVKIRAPAVAALQQVSTALAA